MAVSDETKRSLDRIPPADLPQHIAIIMDGNNRWARKRKLPGVAGHKAGVAAVRAVIEACGDLNIGHLTLFAFSSENWQRPPDEVSALMELFITVLDRETRRMHKNGIRLQIIGDRSRFSQRLQKRMQAAEELTANNSKLVLTVAANYGGRWDIAQACAKVAEQAASGQLAYADINEDVIGKAMNLADLPDPDLCIRTGGEHRISNFLLWQFAYTELYFSDAFWPDFRHDELGLAVLDYTRRQRRFGLTGEQVEGKVSC